MRNTRCKADIFTLKFIFVLIIACVFSSPCSAQDITQQIMEFSGADNLTRLAPPSVSDMEELYETTPSQNGPSRVLERILNLIRDSIRQGMKGFTALCAFLVICALLRLHGGVFGSGAVVDYICILCISGYCYSFVADTVELVTRAISEIDTFMSAMLPVMASLYTVSGNAAAALSQNAGMYAALTLFEKINASFIVPMFGFLFALTMVCAVSGTDLSGIVRFIKNFIIRLCVTLMTLLVSVLFFQSTFSSAADTLAMRGVKYAASLIPIVGTLVGEATRTVAASISVIKTSAGIFAVTAVLYTALIPAAALICKKTMLSICAIVGRIVGAAREAVFIEEINGIMSILLAVLMSVAVFFILAVTIFIKTAVSV